MLTRQDCLDMDRRDALAPLARRFAIPDGVIYLDGNSLGAMPIQAQQRVQQVTANEWGRQLIRSWNTAGWFELPRRLGDKLAPLIGAQSGEVVITDSTSVNLFKALAAALRMQADDPDRKDRRVIVTERSNFPTDVYIVQGLAGWLNRGYEVRLVDEADDIEAAIDDSTAVVMLTHVNYRTGRLLDMAALSARAHAQGALIIWDLAHSAGAVPVDLAACNADFAVGCTYKYLNGGPGAPAFIWVPHRHQANFSQPLTGWWGHAAPFAMQPDFKPSGSISAALCGTQPIVSLSLVECGLDIFASTDMASLRTKSLAMTDLFIGLVEQRCATHPVSLVTPRAHSQRGSQVSFRHPHAYAVVQALIERGVIGDYREPEIMRFGFTPLYLRFADVWDAVDALADILDNGTYDTGRARDAVT